MRFEDLGGELGEGVSAIVRFGLGVHVNAVFGKDGGGAASATPSPPPNSRSEFAVPGPS